jgi:hypothetical protein
LAPKKATLPVLKFRRWRDTKYRPAQQQGS